MWGYHISTKTNCIVWATLTNRFSWINWVSIWWANHTLLVLQNFPSNAWSNFNNYLLNQTQNVELHRHSCIWLSYHSEITKIKTVTLTKNNIPIESHVLRFRFDLSYLFFKIKRISKLVINQNCEIHWFPRNNSKLLQSKILVWNYS